MYTRTCRRVGPTLLLFAAVWGIATRTDVGAAEPVAHTLASVSVNAGGYLGIPLGAPGGTLSVGVGTGAPVGLSRNEAGTVRCFAGFWPVTQSAAAPTCPGDCDDDGEVTVDELVRGVSITLGSLGLDACPTFDTGDDGNVTIDEVVTAVNAALAGCPP